MRGGNGLGWTEGENALCAAFILLVAAPPPQDGWGSGVEGARRPTPSRLPSPQPLPHATLSFPIPWVKEPGPSKWLEKSLQKKKINIWSAWRSSNILTGKCQKKLQGAPTSKHMQIRCKVTAICRVSRPFHPPQELAPRKPQVSKGACRHHPDYYCILLRAGRGAGSGQEGSLPDVVISPRTT